MVTFINWLNGEVEISGSDLNFHVTNIPNFVSISDFSEDDQVQIVNHLKELFERYVDESFCQFKTNCEAQLENSQEKKALITKNIQQITEILNGDIHFTFERFNCSYWEGISFDHQSYKMIVSFYVRHIEKGHTINYFFLQNENSPLYQSTLKSHPFIYSYSIWKFKKWLENYLLCHYEKGTDLEKARFFNKLLEFKESDLKILKNEGCFHFLCALVEKILVNEPNSNNTSFIFRKFLLEKFFFKPQIPQIDFIEYLNNRFGFDIPPVKLGTFEKKINNSIYLNLKEKFHWVN